MKRKISKLERHIEQLVAERNSLMQEIDRYREHITELKSQDISLKENLYRKKEEIDALNVQAKEVSTAINKGIQESKELQDASVRLQLNLKDGNTKVHELEGLIERTLESFAREEERLKDIKERNSKALKVYHEVLQKTDTLRGEAHVIKKDMERNEKIKKSTEKWIELRKKRDAEQIDRRRKLKNKTLKGILIGD